MSIQEIEAAVSQLQEEDLAAFQAWFDEFMADAWDARIAADAAAGKLDHLVAEADAEFNAGRCTPL
jgi:hypothetical protein